MGEHVEKYYYQGLKVAVTGHIQTGSYINKDGVKVYTTEVVVEEQEFVESKGSNDKSQGNILQKQEEGFLDVSDEELPFK